MQRPIFVVLSEDESRLEALTGDLRRRYDADYRIVAVASAGAALALLAEQADSGPEVALLIADEHLAELPVVPTVPADNPCTYSVRKEGSDWSEWIDIGEAHAYYDATADFIFDKGSSYDIGVGLSTDGGSWGIAGTVDQGTHNDWSDGLNNLGPYQAQVMQLDNWFQKDKGTVTCLHGGPYPSSIYVVPDGIDNPGGAGPLRWHGDVSGGDGKAQWQGQEQNSQPRIHNVNWIPRNDTAGRCIERGQTLTYTVAFSGPGFSVGMSTSFSMDGRDCIYTGKGTAHLHWEWGADGAYTSPRAHVLYSY